MVFKSKSYKLSCPRLCMDNQLLKYTDDIKYLGFIFSSDQKDDNNLLRQLKMLYTESNRLLRLHGVQCSTGVQQLGLFRSYQVKLGNRNFVTCTLLSLLWYEIKDVPIYRCKSFKFRTLGVKFRYIYCS